MDQTVSILLDEEKSTMEFIDASDDKVSLLYLISLGLKQRYCCDNYANNMAADTMATQSQIINIHGID